MAASIGQGLGNGAMLLMTRAVLRDGHLDPSTASCARRLAELGVEVTEPGRGARHALWRAEFEMGKTLARQGKWGEAVAAYKKAVAHNPGPPHPYYLTFDRLGDLYLAADDRARARAAFEDALTHNPRDVHALVSIGKIVYHMQGQAPMAELYFEQAVTAAEGWYTAHQICVDDVGSFYRAQGELDAAQRWYQRALEIYPRSYWARAYLGINLFEAGDLDTAEEVLREAIDINADLHAAHVFLGFVHGARGHYRQAAESFERGLMAAPEREDTYVYLSDAWLKAGDCRRAYSVYQELAATSPSSPALNPIQQRIQESGCAPSD